MDITTEIDNECMIAICAGASNCENCINNIYQPILNQLEDSHCTGLVIDKRQIDCSHEKKSLALVADTIIHYKNRSPLRKLAIVTSIKYTRDEEILQSILFEKGLNIRLFSDINIAIDWAHAYP